MIFIYGYDEYFASDGVSELIALVNNYGGCNVDAQGNLQREVLVRTLQTVERSRYDFVTVMHLRADTTPGRVEYWQARYVAADEALQANQVRVDAFTVYELYSKVESLPTVPCVE